MMTAAKYYELMERPFQALCPERSGYMNFGLWPAATLREAQAALVDAVLDALGPALRPATIVEGGSGWGSSRAHVAAHFPNARYTGINLSAAQVAHATEVTAAFPATRYVNAPIEQLAALDLGPIDAFFAVEAAIHFRDKDALLRTLAGGGTRSIALGEIVFDESDAVLASPVLAPALHQCWSLARYQQSLHAAGFTRQTVTDVSARVFAGMAAYTSAIDPAKFPENPEILRQLRRAFVELAALASAGKVAYVVIGAHTP